MKLTKDEKIAMVTKAVQARLDEAANDPTNPVTGEELARIMLECLAIADTGDPLGMVRINPDTGATADRLMVGTDVKWRVTVPGDPNVSYDTSPTMQGWDVAYDPTAIRVDPLPETP
jgi:hypothetical protein